MRDLLRPMNSLFLHLYVKVLGAEYNGLQKKLYHDSLAAGFTRKELESMANEAGISDFSSVSHFITHVGIEKKAQPYEEPDCNNEFPTESDMVARIMKKCHITR